MVHLGTLKVLGGHVRKLAAHDPGLGLVQLIGSTRDSEIDEFYVAGIRNHEILRAHITVDNSEGLAKVILLGVSVPQSSEQPDRYEQAFFRREAVVVLCQTVEHVVERETVDELHKRSDWASPISKQAVITGDGSEDYSLPTNFLRLADDPMCVYETSTTRRAAIPITSDGAWTHLKEIGTAGGARYYKIEGYEGNQTIGLYRNPSASDSITVSYVSNVWMISSGGTEGCAFTDAGDISLFPRRILELGIVWRFRKRKGLPYSDIAAEYEAWLATNANRNRRVMSVGFGNVNQDYHPMRQPVPDFIPPS